MLVGGGLALAADRVTLRVFNEQPGERERHLGELNAIHRPVLISLAVLFITGIAMVAADVATFLVSPVLWVKLTLVALLVVNGVILERTETALRRADGSSSWERLRLAAYCSIGLWIARLHFVIGYQCSAAHMTHLRVKGCVTCAAGHSP